MCLVVGCDDFSFTVHVFEYDDGDVVFSTTFVGSGDEFFGNGLCARAVLHEALNVLFFDHLGQTIATKDDSITREELQGSIANIRFNVGTGAKCAAKDMTIRVILGFFLAEQPNIDKVLHDGMIARQLLKLPGVTEDINPTIPNVCEVEQIALYHREDTGGPHTREFFVLLSTQINALVCEIDSLSKCFLGMLDIGIAKVLFDSFDNEVTCECSASIPPHAISDDQHMAIFDG